MLFISEIFDNDTCAVVDTEDYTSEIVSTQVVRDLAASGVSIAGCQNDIPLFPVSVLGDKVVPKFEWVDGDMQDGLLVLPPDRSRGKQFIRGQENGVFVYLQEDLASDKLTSYEGLLKRRNSDGSFEVAVYANAVWKGGGSGTLCSNIVAPVYSGSLRYVNDISIKFTDEAIAHSGSLNTKLGLISSKFYQKYIDEDNGVITECTVDEYLSKYFEPTSNVRSYYLIKEYNLVVANTIMWTWDIYFNNSNVGAVKISWAEDVNWAVSFPKIEFLQSLVKAELNRRQAGGKCDWSRATLNVINGNNLERFRSTNSVSLSIGFTKDDVIIKYMDVFNRRVFQMPLLKCLKVIEESPIAGVYDEGDWVFIRTLAGKLKINKPSYRYLYGYFANDKLKRYQSRAAILGAVAADISTSGVLLGAEPDASGDIIIPSLVKEIPKNAITLSYEVQRIVIPHNIEKCSGYWLAGNAIGRKQRFVDITNSSFDVVKNVVGGIVLKSSPYDLSKGKTSAFMFTCGSEDTFINVVASLIIKNCYLVDYSFYNGKETVTYSADNFVQQGIIYTALAQKKRSSMFDEELGQGEFNFVKYPVTMPVKDWEKYLTDQIILRIINLVIKQSLKNFTWLNKYPRMRGTTVESKLQRILTTPVDEDEMDLTKVRLSSWMYNHELTGYDWRGTTYCSFISVFDSLKLAVLAFAPYMQLETLKRVDLFLSQAQLELKKVVWNIRRELSQHHLSSMVAFKDCLHSVADKYDEMLKN